MSTQSGWWSGYSASVRPERPISALQKQEFQSAEVGKISAVARREQSRLLPDESAS